MEEVLATRPRTFGQPAGPAIAPSTIKPRAKPPAASWLHGISKPMLSLVSDVRNFQGVEGPFAPLSGPDSLTFCGGLTALQRTHGVDITGLERGDLSAVYERQDARGNTWYCRWLGDPFWTAFRERTTAELIKMEEKHAENLVRMVPTYRFMCLRRIAIELMVMAEAMSPDRCPARSARRSLKKRIAALGQLQFDMLCGTSITMTEIRERMEALDVEFPYSIGNSSGAAS